MLISIYPCSRQRLWAISVASFVRENPFVMSSGIVLHNETNRHDCELCEHELTHYARSSIARHWLSGKRWPAKQSRIINPGSDFPEKIDGFLP